MDANVRGASSEHCCTTTGSRVFLVAVAVHLSGEDLAGCGKTRKYVIPNPVRFLNGARNLLFPWLSCEPQIPHPQTTRVRDDKRAFFRSLLGSSCLDKVVCGRRRGK